MAVAYRDPVLRPPAPRREQGRAFSYGAPASRFESIAGRLISVFELLHVEHVEERPPVALTVTKLVLWVVVATSFATVGVVGLAALAVRIWTGTFG